MSTVTHVSSSEVVQHVRAMVVDIESDLEPAVDLMNSLYGEFGLPRENVRGRLHRVAGQARADASKLSPDDAKKIDHRLNCLRMRLGFTR